MGGILLDEVVLRGDKQEELEEMQGALVQGPLEEVESPLAFEVEMSLMA